MKKILNILASIACIVGVILAGCEGADGTCNLGWTLGWMAVALASGLYLGRYGRERGRQD